MILKDLSFSVFWYFCSTNSWAWCLWHDFGWWCGGCWQKQPSLHSRWLPSTFSFQQGFGAREAHDLYLFLQLCVWRGFNANCGDYTSSFRSSWCGHDGGFRLIRPTILSNSSSVSSHCPCVLCKFSGMTPALNPYPPIPNPHFLISLLSNLNHVGILACMSILLVKSVHYLKPKA